MSRVIDITAYRFPQTSATETACRTQACAQAQRWRAILKEYNQLEGAYSRKFPDAVSPLKPTGAGRGKGKGALTWDALMADYDMPAEDRKLLALLWPHVREMGHTKDDRTICVGYFAANVVLGLDQKRAITQCKAHLKSLNLPSDAEVSNKLQIILDGIGPTFETIIKMEERKDKIAKMPGKGKGRVGLPRGGKSTPTKAPLKTTRSQRLVKELPLKRPREEAECDTEREAKGLPMPKRVRVDSSTRSEFSVIEESDLAEAPPSSEAEVESIVQTRFGRGNRSIIVDVPDEGAEGDGGMDGMEVDEPIARARSQRRRISKPEPAVEEMDWPALAAYRRRLMEARSKDRDTTELSRARSRPVFADRKYWEVAV